MKVISNFNERTPSLRDVALTPDSESDETRVTVALDTDNIRVDTPVTCLSEPQPLIVSRNIAEDLDIDCWTNSARSMGGSKKVSAPRSAP